MLYLKIPHFDAELSNQTVPSAGAEDGADDTGFNSLRSTFALRTYALEAYPKKLCAANNPYSLSSSPCEGVPPLL